jgi:hypothetical protein
LHVAATSSAVPVVGSPVTSNNQVGPCGYEFPTRVAVVARHRLLETRWPLSGSS